MHVVFSLFAKRLAKKLKKSPLARKVFAGMIITPIVVVCVMVFSFFAFDQFNYYYATLLWSQQGGIANSWGGQGGRGGIGSSWSDSPSGGGGTEGALVPGEIGLRAMYVNKMQGSYYKEFLEIIRDHCNWKYMPDEAPPVTLDSGEAFYPTIFSILGTGLAETGLDRNNGVSPHAIMNSSLWQETGKYSLGQFNSAVAREHGKSSLANGMPMTLKWGNYYTPYQFSHGMAAVYPDQDYGATSSTVYPSKMNGYGFSDTDKRTREQTDAAYFPDVIALTIQKTYGLLKDWADFNTLHPDGLTASMYATFNAGIGGPGNTWAMGVGAGGDYWWTSKNNKFRRGDWGSANTITKAEVVSGGINIVAELSNEVMTGMEDSMNGVSFNYANQSDYEGLATVALLMNGGFLATDHARQALTERSQAAGFMRGATVAYRIFSGNPSATQQETKTYLDGIKVQSIDTSFYGPAVNGKTEEAVGYNEIMVHMYDDAYKVYNSDNEGPRTLLRAYNLESTRGAFMSVIGGPWIYKNMLQAAGVECTLEDALRDGLGAQVQEAPGSPTAQGDATPAPEGASYYNGGIPFVSFIPGSDTLSRCTSAMYWRNLDISTGVHYGEDYSAKQANGKGIEMAAVADGTVVETGNMNGRGIYIIVQMDSLPGEPKFQYLYQHLTSHSVKKGDRVKAGQIIAVSGGTGGNVSFVTHLHIEVFVWRGNTSQKYVLPFGTLFHRKATGINCPAVIQGRKDADGYVYDANLKVLGTLKAVGDRTNLDYWEQGANYFLDKALKAR